jgi:hypothetical protein
MCGIPLHIDGHVYVCYFVLHEVGLTLVMQPKNNIKYCGIFAQSKNCGARETAVANEWLWNNFRF